MLVDANLLLYATNSAAPEHEAASRWLVAVLNGSQRVGLPWPSLGAFLRIATHPRAFARPLTPATAWEQVAGWLAAPTAWIPTPGPRYADVLGSLITTTRAAGNLVPDAMLAALAIEQGVPVMSTDTDFARFGDVRWVNPLRA